jgi:hypothetical protein
MSYARRNCHRRAAKTQMPKPTPDLSDEQLRQGITSGEFSGRDAAIAEEILRRRHEERASSGQYKLGWLGASAAAFWLWILRLRRR